MLVNNLRKENIYQVNNKSIYLLTMYAPMGTIFEGENRIGKSRFDTFGCANRKL